MDAIKNNPAAAALNKLRAAARKDPKKAGVLMVLAAVMAGLWAKTLLHPDPAAAGAASLAPATDPNAPTAPRSSLPSDKTRGTRPSWSTIKLAPPERNLFLVDFQRYESAGKSTAPTSPVQQSADANPDAPKSAPAPADLKKERQILATNLQQQAAQLKLQTTVMGASPTALVNGSLVGEGDTVASFRVVKITNRGMVIEREGIKLEVQMPGDAPVKSATPR